MYTHPLQHYQPTKNHTLKKNRLSLPQKPPTINTLTNYKKLITPKPFLIKK